jgi:hypothetical protein
MLRLFAENPYVFGILFLAFNVALGLFLVWLAERSPSAGFWQRCSGVAPPVVGAFATIFGMYSAFLANDVWTLHDKAHAAVLREASAVRLLLNAAESVGPQGQPLRALVVDYARASVSSDWTLMDDVDALPLVRALMHEGLFGAAAKAGPQVQRTAMDGIMELRASHVDRVALATATTGDGEWLAILVFGILTQMMMVAIHFGKVRASILAVTLFSVAMTVSMMVIAYYSQPFSGPGAVSLLPIEKALSITFSPVPGAAGSDTGTGDSTPR